MLQFSVRDALPLTNMSNLNIRKAQHLRHNLFPYDIIPLKIWIMTSEFESYIYLKKCLLLPAFCLHRDRVTLALMSEF